MKIEDFKSDEQFSFAGKSDVWNCKDVDIFIDFEDDEHTDELLAKHIESINKKLKWVKENKKVFVKEMIKYDYKDLAEDWVCGAEEDEDEEKECYIMEDGQKVKIPISDEDFFNSVQIDSVSFEPYDDSEEFDLDIFISFSPDYFAGHAVEITVDSDKNIDCLGLMG